MERDELALPASPVSARLARSHVRQRLAQAGRAHWSDAAELAVSEVVTNGLLHAHTGLVLRLEIRSDEVLVEVADGSSVPPTQRHGSVAGERGEGTTGRGLALLAAVTLARGVRATDTGKVVWFTIGPARENDDDAPAAGGDAADWAVSAPARPEQGRPVVLLGFPSTLWLAVREHHQALLRELVLYLAEHGDALPDRPDLVQADAARTLVWTALVAELDRRGGPGPVDLHLVVPAELERAFGALQDALDLAERLARSDLLLVRPGLPEILAVRDWACEQVVAQLAGVPPARWPGTDQEHFTTRVHDRLDAQGPAWDGSRITGAAQAVVAADEANRILAVSGPLAALTGWEPGELVGRRVVALVPPALREAHVAGFSRQVTTGRGALLGVPLVLPVLHADGHEIACTVLLERDESAGRPVYLAWMEPVAT